jgi:glycosyltransferase involved in cell wall biosynthesis
LAIYPVCRVTLNEEHTDSAQRTRNRIAIVIPSFNELNRLATTIRSLVAYLESPLPPSLAQKRFFIVVVDDGSLVPPSPESFIQPASPKISIYLLRHCVNLGQGAAIQTGVEYARETINPDYFVTMDADGQHQPSDLPALFEKLLETESEIVFGNRFEGRSNVPLFRKALLSVATLFEFMITGIRLGDAHNGYRIFTAHFGSLIQLKFNRMAHATEFKQIVNRHRIKYAEAKVDIRYSVESLDKGQTNIGAFRVLRELISGFLFG